MDNFSNLSSKFINITSRIDMLDHIDDHHRTKLNALLNDLTTLDYKCLLIIEHTPVIPLIDSFRNIPIAEDTLIVKSCCLIEALLFKSAIKIPPKVVRPTIQWLLKFIDHNLSVGICDALRAIRALIKANTDSLSELNLIQYFGTLLKTPIKRNKSLNYENCSTVEIKLEAIFCLECITNTQCDIAETTAIEIASVILDWLYNASDVAAFSRKNLCDFRTSAINCLRQLVASSVELCETFTGEIIGVAKAFMLYGLPNIADVQPQKIVQSQQSLCDPNAVADTNQSSPKGGKVAKTKKLRISKRKETRTQSKRNTSDDHRNVRPLHGLTADDTFNFMSLTLTSHSDFSESDTARERIDRHKDAGLRLAAITLIGLIAQKISKKLLYGYWHSLFPGEPITNTSAALLNCVLRDPNAKCRIAALHATSVMLIGSKALFAQAESSARDPPSFMPFSVSLSYMITCMYSAVMQMLTNESSLTVLCEILKCLTVLIQVTPFKRLQSGFMPKCIGLVRGLVGHRDIAVQVAALRTMDFLIASTELTPEIFESIECPDFNLIASRPNTNQLNESGIRNFIETEFDEEECNSENEAVTNEQLPDDTLCVAPPTKMSWLLENVLGNLGVSLSETPTSSSRVVQLPLNIRMESLLVLATMSHHYIWLKPWLKYIDEVLNLSFGDASDEIRLRAAKCLDILGNSMNIYLLTETTPKPENLQECLDFWLSLIPIVVRHVQDPTENAVMKSICCDSLSNIGVYVYEKLPHSQQIILISLLSGSSCDEETSIRAAAVRALAVFVVFPSLRDDMCYVENSIESTIRALSEDSFDILVKGSWALAKISDVLLANSLNADHVTIADDLFERMFNVTLSCKSNDKSRSNIVRTLGNLLRIITADHITNAKWQALCMRAITYLQQSIVSAGKMKVKWNACYSIGNFMKNPVMFSTLGGDGFMWQDLILPSLVNLTTNCPNFKVRTNAVVALASPVMRQHFGQYFHIIWTGLLEALQQSDHMIDYNEYQHRDNLVEQLCIALARYLNLATNDDLVAMAQPLLRLEGIKQYWTRVVNRMVPEKAAPLLVASARLKNCETEMVKCGRRDAWLILHTCFTSPNEYIV